MLTGSRLLIAVLGYLGTIIIVQHVSTSTYGEFAFVFSILGLIGVVSDLQMGRVIFRALGETSDQGAVAGSYLLLRALIGLGSYGVAVAFVVVGGYPADVVDATLVAGVVLITGNLKGAIIAVYDIERWFFAQALSNTLGQLLQFGLIIAVAMAGWHPVLIAFAVPAVFNDLLSGALLLYGTTGHLRLRLRPTPRVWGSWLREISLLALGGALTVAYHRVDSLLLSKLDSLTSVGYYNLAYKLADLLGYLPYALTGVMLAPMVRSFVRDRAEFHRFFRQSILLSVVLAVGGVVMFAGFAAPFIDAAYGRRYHGIAGATQLLVVGEAMHFLTVLCLITLQAAGRNRGYPVVVLGALVFNVAANLVAIPRATYNGAAAVTAVTEVGVAAALLMLTLRLPDVRPLPVRSFAVCLLAAVPAWAARTLLLPVLSWPLAGVTTAAVYLAALHVLRVDGRGGLPALLRNARFATPDPGGVPGFGRAAAAANVAGRDSGEPG